MHDFSRARNMLMSVANNILILLSFKQASCTIGMGEDLSDKCNTFHINGPANLFPRIHGFDFVSIHRKMHCPLIRFCFLLLASWPHVPCCSFCFFLFIIKVKWAYTDYMWRSSLCHKESTFIRPLKKGPPPPPPPSD